MTTEPESHSVYVRRQSHWWISPLPTNATRCPTFWVQPYSWEVPKKRKRPGAGPLWAERGHLELAKITQPLMMANASQKEAMNMEYDYKVTGQIIGHIRVKEFML